MRRSKDGTAATTLLSGACIRNHGAVAYGPPQLYGLRGVMRILLCSLSTPGFLFPMVGLARALSRRGHAVAVMTDETEASRYRLGINILTSGGASRGACFRTHLWAQASGCVLQVKIVNQAINEFRPDAIVAQPLTVGPFVAAEMAKLPIAVVGLFTYLWPDAADAEGTPRSQTQERRQWRVHEMHNLFNAVRRAVRRDDAPLDPYQPSFLGDLFLLRTIPELENRPDALPNRVHMVGPLLWEPTDAGVTAVRMRGWTDVIYVQHGRVFGRTSLWPLLVDVFGDSPYTIVATLDRMAAPTGHLPSNIIVWDRASQAPVLKTAILAIGNGNTTMTLGALTHGVPSILIPSGGEQMDVAERCRELNAAAVVPAAGLSAETLRGNVLAILADKHTRAALANIKAMLHRDRGFSHAARLVEQLAIMGTPVLRESSSPKMAIA